MNKQLKISSLITGLLAFPGIIFAAGADLADIVFLVIDYLNITLVLFMGAAVVIFVYHVVKYFILPNENRSEAGTYVLYSVIGFFVILSFWGIVNVLQNTFGLQNENNRPASWASFSNLFPGGSRRSPTNNTVGPFNQSGNNFGPFDSGARATDQQIERGIDRAIQYEEWQKNEGQI